MMIKTQETTDITTLRLFLDSQYWDGWQESNLSDMPFHDPERYNRIRENAELGGDGSTHGENIDDFRQAWGCFCADFDVPEDIQEKVSQEIDDCEDWHDKNGSLDQVVG